MGEEDKGKIRFHIFDSFALVLNSNSCIEHMYEIMIEEHIKRIVMNIDYISLLVCSFYLPSTRSLPLLALSGILLLSSYISKIL